MDQINTITQPPNAWMAQLELIGGRLVRESGLDALEVGVEIWDSQDRLVLYNKTSNQLRLWSYGSHDIGKTYDALLSVQQQLWDDGLRGTDDSALETTVSSRSRHKEAPLQELAGDRWIKNYETTTPDGYLLIVRVNVTELIRQGRQLEATNRQLALQSTTDSLTCLANRRCFDEMLATEWQRARRMGTHLSLLMVDVDHFKKFNDCYGHIAGDACLRRVAGVLTQCVRRAGELVARYGGEEFVLLLPATDQEQAMETAEKCQRLMRQEAIVHADSSTAPYVTLSVGVACLRKEMIQEAGALLNAADAAMYRAKSEGRARCVQASATEWKSDAFTHRTQHRGDCRTGAPP